ncbi:MAG: hypothetical protein AB1671_03185 [Thermodesulfobacteriota bacterium]|jgi:hypothetical protein
MKIDLFGQLIDVEKDRSGWQVYYLGSEGKRRVAHDLVIPSSVQESELVTYLDDLCHERATKKHPCVRRLR